MSTKRTIRVVAALLFDAQSKHSFLIQQRLSTGERANLWEFPGGKVEAGESDESALARECKEELGIDVVVLQKLTQVTHEYADLVVNLHLFLTQKIHGVPQAHSAQRVQFSTLAEMKLLPFCEADVPLLDELESLL